MPIDPIKIPQNVYIEDRIVGPLTLKQIIIVAIGCGFSYALYSILLKSYGAVPLPVTVMAWVPGVLSVIFAFVKLNDLSMFRLVLLMLERVNKPKTRTWAPRRGLEINIRVASPKSEKAAPQATQKKTHSIDELSAALDSQSAEEDIPAASEPDATPADDSSQLAVNPARISASPLNSPSADTIAAPTHATSSIFRDISPHA